MSKADEYRNHADLCRECAAMASTPQSREAWLSIADDWLGMIPEGETSSPPLAEREEGADKSEHQDRLRLFEQEVSRPIEWTSW